MFGVRNRVIIQEKWGKKKTSLSSLAHMKTQRCAKAHGGCFLLRPRLVKRRTPPPTTTTTTRRLRASQPRARQLLRRSQLLQHRRPTKRSRTAMPRQKQVWVPALMPTVEPRSQPPPQLQHRATAPMHRRQCLLRSCHWQCQQPYCEFAEK